MRVFDQPRSGAVDRPYWLKATCTTILGLDWVWVALFDYLQGVLCLLFELSCWFGLYLRADKGIRSVKGTSRSSQGKAWPDLNSCQFPKTMPVQPMLSFYVIFCNADFVTQVNVCHFQADPNVDQTKIREYHMKAVELQKQLLIDNHEAQHLQVSFCAPL